jgi:hypothetical protein
MNKPNPGVEPKTEAQDRAKALKVSTLPFSDQDLEDFRDAVGVEVTAPTSAGSWYVLFKTEKVEALLRRLELAEGVCSGLERGDAVEDLERGVRAWFRACGNE